MGGRVGRPQQLRNPAVKPTKASDIIMQKPLIIHWTRNLTAEEVTGVARPFTISGAWSFCNEGRHCCRVHSRATACAPQPPRGAGACGRPTGASYGAAPPFRVAARRLLETWPRTVRGRSGRLAPRKCSPRTPPAPPRPRNTILHARSVLPERRAG